MTEWGATEVVDQSIISTGDPDWPDFEEDFMGNSTDQSKLTALGIFARRMVD